MHTSPLFSFHLQISLHFNIHYNCEACFVCQFPPESDCKLYFRMYDISMSFIINNSVVHNVIVFLLIQIHPKHRGFNFSSYCLIIIHINLSLMWIIIWINKFVKLFSRGLYDEFNICGIVLEVFTYNVFFRSNRKILISIDLLLKYMIALT